MVKTNEQMTIETRENMRGGDGTVTLKALFKAGEYDSKLRLFSRITLPAGASIGYHIHDGEEEFYYFLEGSAEYNDNGEIKAVKAGDATITKSGQGHSVKNTGDRTLELIAVIAFV